MSSLGRRRFYNGIVYQNSGNLVYSASLADQLMTFDDAQISGKNWDTPTNTYDVTLNGVYHVAVYAKGQNIRDWIYVEDHCKAILDVFYGGGVGQKYNIGGECEVKNIDLVKTIIKLMGASEDLIEYVQDRPGHDLRYAIDNAKIKKALNFRPQHTLEEGLTKTIIWYKYDRI